MRPAILLLLVSLVALAFAGEEKLESAHVRAGQTYRWKLAAGNTSVWEIVGKTDEKVSYKIRCTVAGKEAPGKDDVHEFLLRRTSENKEPVSGTKETLRVSGIEFPCAVLETESGGQAIKTWRSEKFPEILKVQLGKDVTAELVEIR